VDEPSNRGSVGNAIIFVFDKEAVMDVAEVLNAIQNHPRITDAGMILTHLGLVRSYSLDGRTVTAMTVRHDVDRVEAIRRELLERPGIVEIIARVNQGRLEPGDPVMVVAVAGGTRDQVFPVLQEMIERIKKQAAEKHEETV
jgi:molybdopterin synthase catalytic subunit